MKKAILILSALGLIAALPSCSSQVSWGKSVDALSNLILYILLFSAVLLNFLKKRIGTIITVIASVGWLAIITPAVLWFFKNAIDNSLYWLIMFLPFVLFLVLFSISAYEIWTSKFAKTQS
jgi:hypothetical protein